MFTSDTNDDCKNTYMLALKKKKTAYLYTFINFSSSTFHVEDRIFSRQFEARSNPGSDTY